MTIGDLLLELIFPSFCLYCRRRGPWLCQHCYQDLQFYFLQNHLAEVHKHFTTNYLDQLLILARFRGALATMLKTLKYQNSKNLAPFLAKMLWQHLALPQADLISFVPLHPQKLKTRGYNQCQEIAITLSQLSAIPAKNLLNKRFNTSAQAQVHNQQQRLHRMAEAFVVRKKHSQLIKDKEIILLDDVLTTGATLNAAAGALKTQGAKKIFGLIVASKME